MPRCRSAFTLIEMLVVIGIIGILTALLVPAVQQARETARQGTCSNWLKQLSLAASAYHETHNVYPLGRDCFVGGTFVRSPGWSAHARLLPFIEKGALYELIDFDDPLSIRSMEARHTNIAEFICPSDSSDRLRGPADNHQVGHGRNSYKGNAGNDVGELFLAGEDTYEQNNGIFLSHHAVRAAQIRDGLTYTAMFAESVRGDGNNQFASVPGDWFVIGAGSPSAQQVYDACMALDPDNRLGDSQQISQGGRNWAFGEYISTRYNHILPPNARSCARGGDPDMNDTGGATTASSYHPGGVNVAMCDGSVRMVTEGIATHIWQALGSRAGGEVHDLNY